MKKYNIHTYYLEKYDCVMLPMLEATLCCHPEVIDDDRKLPSDYNDFEIYFKFFRNQILDFLRSGKEDNYVAAMTLTIPIIDRASQIALSKEVKTNECLDWLNSVDPNSEENINQRNHLNDSLRKLFVNGLKHDAFVREGVSIKTHPLNKQEQFLPVQEYPDEDLINVHPIQWCRFVIGRLDFFYIMYVVSLLHMAHEQGDPRGKELASNIISQLEKSSNLIRFLP